MTPLEGGTGPLGPLMPHYLTEVVVGIVLMLIIWWVVAKQVVPKFEAMYEERADAIRGGMERAEKAQEDAAAALAQYKAQLSEARGEAAKIREDAKNAGAQIQAEMREHANAEASRILASAEAQIEADRSHAKEALRREVGGLATALAGKIVGESLTDDDRARRTVDRFLSDLETQSPKA